MRRVLRMSAVGVTVLLAILFPTPPVSSEILSRFHSHGAHASIIWEDGPIFGILSVSQDGRAANRMLTFLFYEIFVEGEPLESGFGFIRNADLSGGSSQRLALSTDTGQGANPAFNRGIGSGGPISVVWQRDPSGIESGSSGTSWVRFGDFTMRTTGNSVFYAASTAGTVMGFVIGGTTIESHLGRHNNATIEILRGK